MAALAVSYYFNSIPTRRDACVVLTVYLDEKTLKILCRVLLCPIQNYVCRGYLYIYQCTDELMKSSYCRCEIGACDFFKSLLVVLLFENAWLALWLLANVLKAWTKDLLSEVNADLAWIFFFIVSKILYLRCILNAICFHSCKPYFPLTRMSFTGVPKASLKPRIR